jgi:FKBP-type peptidyl-prolyl cis-trans isomerase
MRKGLLSIVVLLIAGSAIGCGSDSSSTSGTSEASSTFRIPIPGGRAEVRYEKELTVGKDGLVGPEPKPVFPKGPEPEYLSLVDLIEGIGKLHYEGDPITVQYVGYDYETHKKFASSWDEGRPFTFTLGKGKAIPGWEEGVQELEGGDRRELVIPPSETQGPFPKGAPKDHAAIFVVEAVPTSSAKGKQAAGGKAESPPRPAKKSSQGGTASNKSKPKVEVPSGPPPKKLEIKDLEEGSGPAAKAGDEVTVQYVGVNYKTGEQFDASWDRGEPFTFKLGEELVIPGWEEGIVGMKPGGRRELIIPPELGYGFQRSGTIPPGSTLIFVVDLISVG